MYFVWLWIILCAFQNICNVFYFDFGTYIVFCLFYGVYIGSYTILNYISDVPTGTVMM